MLVSIYGAPLVNADVVCRPFKSERSVFLQYELFVYFWTEFVVIHKDDSTQIVYRMFQQFISKCFMKLHKSLLFLFSYGISMFLIQLIPLHNLIHLRKKRQTGRPLLAAVIQQNITGATHACRTCKKGQVNTGQCRGSQQLQGLSPILTHSCTEIGFIFEQAQRKCQSKCHLSPYGSGRASGSESQDLKEAASRQLPGAGHQEHEAQQMQMKFSPSGLIQEICQGSTRCLGGSSNGSLWFWLLLSAKE